VSVELNHTIVSCRDQQRSAAFLTGILGLPPATRFAHFLVVQADNGVSLDFAETSGEITAQHYAFLVGEEEFDAAFGRIRDHGLPYWADPGQRQQGVINRRDGGRGLYFRRPRRAPAGDSYPALRQRHGPRPPHAVTGGARQGRA
jgi:catechol 2,3-dioxygenase-like lactoylglutathione lyase family enzyme